MKANTMYRLLHNTTYQDFLKEKVRVCRLCGSTNTTVNKNKRSDGSIGYYPEWYKYDTGFICVNCYHKQHRLETIKNAALKLGYIQQMEVLT